LRRYYPQRARLFDQHDIADFRFGLFVMRVKFAVAGHDFLELRVREPAFHLYDDGFGHLVGDDFAKAFLAIAARRGHCFQIFRFFSHTS